MALNLKEKSCLFLSFVHTSLEWSREIRLITVIFTARNEVGARLCFYTCLWFCSQGGVVVSQHALQVVSQHALQQVSGGGGVWYPSMPWRFPGPHPGGGNWGVWPGGSPGPHLGGSPGPHPGGFPGPHLGGSPGLHLGGFSRPTPGGGCVSQHELKQTPTVCYCCGWYASYWNAFLWLVICLDQDMNFSC